MSKLTNYSIYGISIASDYPFQYPLITAEKKADIVFTCTTTPSEYTQKDSFSQQGIVTVQTPEGQRQVSISKQDDSSYVLQFREFITFLVTINSITAYIHHLPDPSILDMLLFGPALALWRFMQGFLGLHAAAAAIDEKAVLFSAYNHSGKSSLAASCLQVGHALLADDYAAITLEGGEYYVQPGYPQMRMWEDQAAYFIENYQALEFMRENYPKRLTPIGPDGFGQFCHQAKPLRLIYVPQRRMPDDPSSDIIIQPLAKSAAVTTLMRSGAVTYFRRWLPLHQHNLRLISELVSHIPVRMVSYPNGYDLLPSVREALLTDVSNL